MHPDIATRLARYHHDEMIARAHASREWRPAAAPRPLRRRVPRWRVTWTRTTVAEASASGRRSRSWVIIISATRA